MYCMYEVTSFTLILCTVLINALVFNSFMCKVFDIFEKTCKISSPAFEITECYLQSQLDNFNIG